MSTVFIPGREAERDARDGTSNNKNQRVGSMSMFQFRRRLFEELYENLGVDEDGAIEREDRKRNLA